MDHVPHHYGIYGFRAPGSENGEVVAQFSIIEYAQRYVQTIVQHLKQFGHESNPGIVHLLGYCGGGPIVFEMTRILNDMKMIPATMILLDPPNLLAMGEIVATLSVPLQEVGFHSGFHSGLQTFTNRQEIRTASSRTLPFVDDSCTS